MLKWRAFIVVCGIFVSGIMLAVLMCLPTVFALDFDNIGEYDSKTRTMTIKNSFGFGETLAEIQLVSELSVYVMPGEDRKVAEMLFSNFDKNYKNALADIKFYNILESNRRFNRGFVYKRKVQTGTKQQPIYKTTCKEQPTVNGTENKCTTKIDHYDTVPVFGWRKFNSLSEISEISNPTETIGIFTTVEYGDKVEWIPNFYGVNINEWASWTAALNVDLVSYWKMNSTIGDELDIGGFGNNFTSFKNETREQPGINNEAFDISRKNNTIVQTNSFNNIDDQNMTEGAISMWFKVGVGSTVDEGSGTTYALWYFANNSANSQQAWLQIIGDYVETKIRTGATNHYDYRCDSVKASGFEDSGQWVHIVINHNGTSPGIYVNGTRATGCSYAVDNDRTKWIGDVVEAGVSWFVLGADRDSNGTINELNGTIDEVAIWNRSLSDTEISNLYNNGNGIFFASGGFFSNLTVTLDLPIDELETVNNTVTFQVSIDPLNNANLTNATLFIWNGTGELYDTFNNSLTGEVANSTNFTLSFKPDNYTWNVFGCVNVSNGFTCDFPNSNRTFDITEFAALTEEFNSSSFETARESFLINMTTAPSITDVAANLIYSGTTYAGTKTQSGLNYTFTAALDIPLIAGNKTFHWELTLTNSTKGGFGNGTLVQNQTVLDTNLSLCGSEGGTVPYLNLTFKDESTLSTMQANVDASTWYYWLGEGTVAKTLSFLNKTAPNFNYAFCFIPQDRKVNLNLTFKYSNSSYPQRTYVVSSQAFTNTTTNQVLYLLDSSSGIYSSIQALEVTGTPISGVAVTIERQVSGIWVIIGQATGGSDGIVTFWVNPNFPHRITGTRSGYVTSQVTITPSQALYSLIMSKTTGDAEFSGSTEGMSWSTTPPSGYLAPGTYSFAFNLTANLGNLDGGYCKFELVNGSQTVVASTTGGNSSSCNLGISYTHLAGELLYGKLYVDTTNTTGYILIDSDQRWPDIEGTDVSTWSTIYSFFTELKDLDEWGEGSQRQEWNRTVAFFLFLTIAIGIFSFFTQWDSQYPGVAVIMIFVIIMMASFSGWFYIGNASLIDAGYDKIDKYVIAMLTFSLSVAWFTGYLRRTT